MLSPAYILKFLLLIRHQYIKYTPTHRWNHSHSIITTKKSIYTQGLFWFQLEPITNFCSPKKKLFQSNQHGNVHKDRLNFTYSILFFTYLLSVISLLKLTLTSTQCTMFAIFKHLFDWSSEKRDIYCAKIDACVRVLQNVRD